MDRQRMNWAQEVSWKSTPAVWPISVLAKVAIEETKRKKMSAVSVIPPPTPPGDMHDKPTSILLAVRRVADGADAMPFDNLAAFRGITDLAASLDA
jgi:hypothetical protein